LCFKGITIGCGAKYYKIYENGKEGAILCYVLYYTQMPLLYQEKKKKTFSRLYGIFSFSSLKMNQKFARRGIYCCSSVISKKQCAYYYYYQEVQV
jgi:hypothetical protein